MAKINLVLIGFACIVLVGAGTYYYLNKPSLPGGDDSLTHLFSPSPATATSTPAPSAKEVIPSALAKRDYVGLENYLTEQVEVILYASECCGKISRQDAILQLEYLDGAELPWDFSQTDPVIPKLKAEIPENFEGSLIGISQNRYVAAFHINDSGMIEKIILVVDYKIIVP